MVSISPVRFTHREMIFPIRLCVSATAFLPGTTNPGTEAIRCWQKNVREGYTTFIFNFRGSRNSGGNFDINGWIRDLQGVIDYLWKQPEVERRQLVLLGYSARSRCLYPCGISG